MAGKDTLRGGADDDLLNAIDLAAGDQMSGGPGVDGCLGDPEDGLDDTCDA